MTKSNKKRHATNIVTQDERLRIIAKAGQSDQIPQPENYCPNATAQAVYNLTFRQCRFPIGLVGAKDFHFCPDKAQEGYSYCTHHRTITEKPRKEKDNGQKT